MWRRVNLFVCAALKPICFVVCGTFTRYEYLPSGYKYGVRASSLDVCKGGFGAYGTQDIQVCSRHLHAALHSHALRVRLTEDPRPCFGRLAAALRRMIENLRLGPDSIRGVRAGTSN